MTRSTLKAVWVGGGVLATWFAVTPNHSAPPAGLSPAPQQSGGVSAPGSPAARNKDLKDQSDLLRARTTEMKIPPSTRNPFRFGVRIPPVAQRTAHAPQLAPSVVSPASAAVPLLPELSLDGVAEQSTPEGIRRTAVLSAGGQIYLAHQGDLVMDRYTVVSIDPEAVVLRDTTGAELRLTLRP